MASNAWSQEEAEGQKTLSMSQDVHEISGGYNFTTGIGRHSFLPDALNLGEPGSHEIAFVRGRLHGEYMSRDNALDKRILIRFVVNSRKRKLNTYTEMDRNSVKDAFEMADRMKAYGWKSSDTNLNLHDVVDIVALDKDTLRIIKKPVPGGQDKDLRVWMWTNYTRKMCDFRHNGQIKMKRRFYHLETDVPVVKKRKPLDIMEAQKMVLTGYEAGKHPYGMYEMEKEHNCVDVDVGDIFRNRMDSVDVYCDDIVLPRQGDNLMKSGRIASIFVDPDTAPHKPIITLIPRTLHYVPLRGGMVYNAHFEVVVDKHPQELVPFMCKDATLKFHIRRTPKKEEEEEEE